MRDMPKNLANIYGPGPDFLSDSHPRPRSNPHPPPPPSSISVPHPRLRRRWLLPALGPELHDPKVHELLSPFDQSHSRQRSRDQRNPQSSRANTDRALRSLPEAVQSVPPYEFRTSQEDRLLQENSGLDPDDAAPPLPGPPCKVKPYHLGDLLETAQKFPKSALKRRHLRQAAVKVVHWAVPISTAIPKCSWFTALNYDADRARPLAPPCMEYPIHDRAYIERHNERARDFEAQINLPGGRQHNPKARGWDATPVASRVEAINPDGSLVNTALVAVPIKEAKQEAEIIDEIDQLVHGVENLGSRIASRPPRDMAVFDPGQLLMFKEQKDREVEIEEYMKDVEAKKAARAVRRAELVAKEDAQIRADYKKRRKEAYIEYQKLEKAAEAEAAEYEAKRKKAYKKSLEKKQKEEDEAHRRLEKWEAAENKRRRERQEDLLLWAPIMFEAKEKEGQEKAKKFKKWYLRQIAKTAPVDPNDKSERGPRAMLKKFRAEVRAEKANPPPIFAMAVRPPQDFAADAFFARDRAQAAQADLIAQQNYQQLLQQQQDAAAAYAPFSAPAYQPAYPQQFVEPYLQPWREPFQPQFQPAYQPYAQPQYEPYGVQQGPAMEPYYQQYPVQGFYGRGFNDFAQPAPQEQFNGYGGRFGAVPGPAFGGGYGGGPVTPAFPPPAGLATFRPQGAYGGPAPGPYVPPGGGYTAMRPW